jgi:hypothetical protein
MKMEKKVIGYVLYNKKKNKFLDSNKQYFAVNDILGIIPFNTWASAERVQNGRKFKTRYAVHLLSINVNISNIDVGGG